MNPKKRSLLPFIKRRKSQVINFTLITLLLVGFSCQNEEEPAQPARARVSIKPLTDERIKAEIVSMVEGNSTASSGRTNVYSGPPLPSGYDYDNMKVVYIEGTNWTTYVAYSTTATENTSTFKKMVGIYYDEFGTFRNFLHTEWRYKGASPNGPFYTNKYIVPESYPNYYDKWRFFPDTEDPDVESDGRVRPPSECGQRVMDCMTDFYSQRGWWSVGLTLVSVFVPEVAVGVVGGCAIGCGLGW